ncbi:glycoside hydrolase family 65 protein [Lacticaseibacillus camelliae]|uniref:glycoside hydrolase family 65 protein n=1 Tax=Lacticaseibacillus camelliae TaxID=381742 RepID=UPI0012E174F1|nr:glycoside hydrolase family 65 protein [Lacticaseibacillus camelliae]
MLLPDLRRMSIRNAEEQPFLAEAPSSLKFDLASGELRGVWPLRDPSGSRLELTVVSVLGQTLDQFALITYQLRSVDYRGLLTVSNHLTMPVFGAATDDPRQPRPIHTLQVSATQKDAVSETMRIKAPTSGQQITLKLACQDGLDRVQPIVPEQVLTRAVIASVSRINRQASRKRVTPDALQADAKQFWTDFWAKADVQIEGAPALNRALHFNLFQLVSSAGRGGLTNVAAKGVSGVGYEGHYFWDTEMYMLPFYTYATPDIAKALLTYRYHVLPQAKKQARIVGVKDGALFSWRTINGEEASAYFPASTAQFHIDADIAYAVDRYVQVTGDETFLHACGLEIIAETAKFWLHFGAWSPVDGKQRFCFFDVTGPDEYSAMVNNNYYTNRMAKHNLSLAVDWGRRFPEEAQQFGLDDATLTAMAKAAAAVELPFDAQLGINAQDDEAFKKPIWPFADTPKDKYPLLLHYHPLTLYRYQVNKQADTLLADYLFDDVPAVS